VSSLQEIADAGREHRPTFVSKDLRGLDEMHHDITIDDDRARCGDALVDLVDGTVTVKEGDPSATSTLRAAVALAWHVRDRSDASVALDGRLGS